MRGSSHRLAAVTLIVVLSFAWAAAAGGQQRVNTPDSVVAGAGLLAARTFLAELESQGFRYDTTEFFGNRRDAAAACGVSENMLAAIENGRTDFIPGKLYNCYRVRIEGLTHRAQRQQIASVVGVGGAVVDRAPTGGGVQHDTTFVTVHDTTFVPLPLDSVPFLADSAFLATARRDIGNNPTVPNEAWLLTLQAGERVPGQTFRVPKLTSVGELRRAVALWSTDTAALLALLDSILVR